MNEAVIIAILQIISALVLLAEMIIPSMGVLTIISTLFLGYAYYLLWQYAPGFIPIMILINLFSIPTILIIGVRLMARTPLSLKKSLDEKEQSRQYPYKEGDTGVAQTDLRPAGKAQIGEVYADVLSTGDYIDKGSAIIIVSIGNGGVHVAKVTEEYRSNFLYLIYTKECYMIPMPVILIGGFVLFIVFIIFIGSPFMLWFQAVVSGAKVGLLNIVFMRIRKVPPSLIVNAIITSTKAGLNITSDDLEAHYLSGGNVMRVVQALIAASRANIEITFQTATGIDLAGRNVLEAVQMSVNPKVIETPLVAAVAKDGIQLKAISRITVRANIDRLVGGAGEETILARVGEGIVTTIGSADSHKLVLENPDMISTRVLEKGLDAGTAFEILSIDIADVDVGKNIGAELETDRAEADKKIAQAKAEERRAMAHAREQEMIARVQEMRALVVEKEAEIPMAMADAFRAGNMGVMDYYKMNNVKADTEMRKSIGKDKKGGSI